jgi:hypothetical protein
VNWTYDEDGDVHVSECGRFWLRQSAAGWEVLDWLFTDKSGNPTVWRVSSLDEAKAFAEDESEWGPLGENLSPARPEW